MKRITYLLLMLALGVTYTSANPAFWSFTAKEVSSEKLELQFFLTLDEGWRIFSQNSDPNGPQPMIFSYSHSDNYTLDGKVTEPTPKREHDDLFDIDLSYFSGMAVFRQVITRKTSEAFKVTGTIHYQLADARGTSLAPAQEPFIIFVPAAEKKKDQPQATKTLFWMAENGKNGFMDINGKTVLRAQWDGVRDFQEGVAWVRIGNKWGLIDMEGHYIVKPKYSGTNDFSEGLAGVTVGNDEEGLMGFIDTKGKMVIPAKYTIVANFHQGLAYVMVGDWGTGKYGYINKHGKTVIPTQFESANDFCEGRALVKKNGKYGFIDLQGNLVVPCIYKYAGNFHDGLAWVCNSDNKYGFINPDGKVVIDFAFSEAGNFNEGMAWVKTNGRCTYYNLQRKPAVSSNYDDAYDFSEGLAAVRVGYLWGFIDHSGKMVIAPQFDSDGIFHNGLALVSFTRDGESRIGYIDKKGRVVKDWPDPEYDFD